jgi:hyperosmotically inducible periplasmic protein
MNRYGLKILFLLAAVAITGCAEGRHKESAGQYLDDTAITTRVKTALVNEPAVSAANINVETYKGTVQLSGFANSDREREIAASVARTVAGVNEVRNDVRIKPQ